MSRQADLFNDVRAESQAIILTRGNRTCKHGESGIGWLGPEHCPSCMWRVVEMCAAFQRDVVAGVYDAEGYTRNERRRQQKKREGR